MATNQFLTFTLAEEQYGVEVVQVREVLSEIPLTVIPRMPDYMKGVINIRGSVVPVVDLRTKFGLPETEKTVDTSIIVMDLHTGESTVTVGCLADSVQEVVDIAEDTIEPPPTIGTSVDARFIRGLGQKDERFVIILDIDLVFQAEAEGLAGVQEAPATRASVSE
ncbi:MAG: chemotaxis protein CheW [Spirochaeta sp.]|jgi:purine-binding chemotaxis protein CheW|nr:chemotaxis protein CheW [Spirochaeta sp.]